MIKDFCSNIKKLIKNKKGDIALIGIVITITVTLFLQGYLDTTSANFILEEAQSMIDLTALTTLESSVDTDGLSYERMTIRPYDFDYEAYHYNQVQNGNEGTSSNQYSNSSSVVYGSTTGTDAQQYIANHSIWLDGTNAYYIEHYKESEINSVLRTNFDYYMSNFLVNQLAVDGVNILSYKVTSFTGTLSYDNWGINRKYHVDTVTYEGDPDEIVNGVKTNGAKTKTTDEYIYMPQATIDATIQLEVDVDPTFTTAGYTYVLYNAQKTSENAGVQTALSENSSDNNYTVASGTYLIDSGFNDDNNLVLTIRVVARQTFY
jgi:hypothetical protein